MHIQSLVNGLDGTICVGHHVNLSLIPVIFFIYFGPAAPIIGQPASMITGKSFKLYVDDMIAER